MTKTEAILTVKLVDNLLDWLESEHTDLTEGWLEHWPTINEEHKQMVELYKHAKMIAEFADD
jgi:hypothetical protein